MASHHSRHEVGVDGDNGNIEVDYYDDKEFDAEPICLDVTDKSGPDERGVCVWLTLDQARDLARSLIGALEAAS